MSTDNTTQEEVPTGKEVEQEMLQQEQQEAQAMSPEDVASQLLYMYTPIYENLVNGLSSKARTRLLKKLISFPLNEKELASTSQQEEQAFQIGNRLLEAKYVLIMDTYAKNIESMQKQSELETQQNPEENK